MKFRKQLYLILFCQSLFVASVFAQAVETNEVERTKATDTENTKTSESERSEKKEPESSGRNESKSEPDKPREIETPKKKSETKKEEREEDNDSRSSSNMSIGAWGGMYFPISPSGANSGIGFGVDGYYSVSKNLQVGPGIGILPYRVTVPGGLFGGAVSFSYMPVLAQAKYWVTDRIYAGAGLGVVLATGAVSGFGTGLTFFGGYAYPLTGSISLDFGLKSYIIKDSKSDAYINLIPNIGITYKF